MEALYVALIILVLVVLNGLYVAAEFALVSVPRGKVSEAAEKGSGLARQLHSILSEPRAQDRYIAATQLGVTFASLGLGMYGEHALAHGMYDWFEGWGFGDSSWIGAHAAATFLSILILTVLHVVIGEMVPKTLALASPFSTAFATLPVTLTTRTLLYPLVRFVEWVSNRLLRWIGIDRSEPSHAHTHTEDDLRAIVDESRAMGLLRKEAGKVMADLLEFGNLKAGDVMVPRVKMRGIELGAEPEELRQLLQQQQHTRFPVFEESLDQILGMVHIKDLLRLLREDRRLERHAVRPISFVPESIGVNRVLQIMRRDRTHIVVVMDEQGGTAGLLTVKDFFEEVVGNIEEGADKTGAHHDAWRDEIGRLRVAGTLRLDELAEETNSDLPEADVETVSWVGLVAVGSTGSGGRRDQVRCSPSFGRSRGRSRCERVSRATFCGPEDLKLSNNLIMQPQPDDLLKLLHPILAVLEKDALADPAQTHASLTRAFPPNGREWESLRSALQEAEKTDWLLPKGEGGMRFGRLAKDLQGYSIDVVRMASSSGPQHRHPNGEVDLMFAWEGEPKFDGHPEGWAIYGRGSEHVPAVADGTMMIVYFLPGGAIEWL